MQSKFLRPLISVSLFSVIILWSCSKIDKTTIGSELIPAIDNVHTFADTLDVNTTQGVFTDSTRMTAMDNYVLGSINNDPVFGKTTANLYFQVKPPTFPFSFGPKDSLTGPDAGLDSVVLTLSYKGFYGDTNQVQHLKVYELNPATSNFKDSSYKLDFTPNLPLGNLLGETTVDVRGISQYHLISDGDDSVNNQIRIKLNTNFATKLWEMDSTDFSPNNAFYRDTPFVNFYKGFAIVADEGNTTANGLMYISLADVNTRLEVHYRRKNAGRIDTTFTRFPFVPTSGTMVKASAHANNIKRDRSGSEFGTKPEALYLQTTPGSYALLEIPQLDTLSNRIVHRAELIVEQIPGDASSKDNIFINPGYLYVDLKDNTPEEKYKPLYFDLNPNTLYNPDNTTNFFPSSIDYSTFGGFAKHKIDPLTGKSIAYYTFNLSRYVQNIVTGKLDNYKLRLYSPFELLYNKLVMSYNNSLAFGRIKIGSGSNADYKLRVRIVYSNL